MDRPLLLSVVISETASVCRQPAIELKCRGVCLKPVSQLVLWCELGPESWERHIGSAILLQHASSEAHRPDLQMVIEDRIMQDQVMVSFSPVIANSSVSVNHQSVYTQQFQAGSKRQACLARTFQQSAVF